MCQYATAKKKLSDASIRYSKMSREVLKNEKKKRQ
jgi:hypothetical protein